MKIGPKYKIARRLGAPVFEKTQTQKFALGEGRKQKKGFSRPKTDFGLQLNEKQKARMFYGVTEKQFAKYVKEALKNTGAPKETLLRTLEERLDNVVGQALLAPTHMAARQAVAHGHFLVNGRRVYVPSYRVKMGDKISIREGSRKSPMFTHLDNTEKGETRQIPAWLTWDNSKKELLVKTASAADAPNLMFDLGQVIEYYQR